MKPQRRSIRFSSEGKRKSRNLGGRKVFLSDCAVLAHHMNGLVTQSHSTELIEGFTLVNKKSALFAIVFELEVVFTCFFSTKFAERYLRLPIC